MADKLRSCNSSNDTLGDMSLMVRATVTRAIVVVLPTDIDCLVITMVASPFFITPTSPFPLVVVSAVAIYFTNPALVIVILLLFTLTRARSLDKLI
jgi:hypothetical protein